MDFDDECDIKSTLAVHLGAFILSKSERNMNNFIRKIDAFYTNNIFCSDTDSLYIERKYNHLLDRAELVGGG